VVLSRTANSLTEPDISPVVQHVRADVLFEPALEEILRGCGTVFHLAALTDVSQSFLHPERYWETNVRGTIRVLEACRKAEVGHFVYASTGLVYGVPEQLPVTENHPIRPLSVYAASKFAGEAAVQGHVAAFGMRGTAVRLTNFYGADSGPGTVIGRAISQAMTGGPIQLRNLTPVRDWIYVDDAVGGLLRLAALPIEPAGYRVGNVGSGRGIKIQELAETLAGVATRLGFGNIQVASPTETTPERVPAVVLDNKFLKAMTGWIPAIGLEQGLTFSLQERRIVI
jgi:UDP-glucose 4-epimerase